MDRAAFRAHALDDALLLFQPSTGISLRACNRLTRGLRRRAPRVVMFGITNACDLRCAFCSRDRGRKDHWTVDSAAQALEGLWRAGSLEVAFGGGEPFLFRGFADLIDRLHASTSLALNVTTHGGRIDETMWSAYAGKLGQVRVSHYEDSTWRRCAQIFARTGQRWGLNLLVDRPMLAKMPELLAAAAAEGCTDVSLLNYVGVPERRLDLDDRRRLAAIVEDAPLACRVSVCFGGQLSVPRLMAGYDHDGDCGAGHDFVTVTSDGRVQSCSFQDEDLPGTDAETILHAWSMHRPQLLAASEREGCARQRPSEPPSSSLPALALWRGFSGNNSGECLLVARFGQADSARAFVDELWPAIEAAMPRAGQVFQGAEYPEAWKELFRREQVVTPLMASGATWCETPRELVSLGRSVLAMGYGLEDMFPELRALAWKRGGRVLPHGIHVHECVRLLVGIRGHHRDDAARVAEALQARDLPAHRHGDLVFCPAPLDHPELHDILSYAATVFEEVADGRPLAAELYADPWSETAWTEATKRLGVERPEHPRLWVRVPASFDPAERGRGAERITKLAGVMDGASIERASHWLLVDRPRGRKRLAVLALRQGAEVHAFDAPQLRARANFVGRPVPKTKGRKVEIDPEVDLGLVREGLAGFGIAGEELEISAKAGYSNVHVYVGWTTANPAHTLRGFQIVAEDLGYSVWSGLQDTDELGRALARLRGDLRR